jgi:hypothetical protein
MRSAAFLVMAAAASVLAQDAGNYTSSYNMTIDPNSVTDLEKGQWCRAQYDTCETLCSDNTNSNDCTTSDLSWDCTCASNNSMPGLEYYTQTMPTFICMELYAQCVAATDDSRVQDECTSNIRDKCGEQNPPKSVDAEETSTTAEASSSTTTGDSSSATGGDVTTTDTEDIAAPTLMPGNGVAAVAAIGVLAYML